MYLSVSIGGYLYFTVSPSAMELLHVFNCLILILAVSNCLSGSKELLHVSHCLL